MLVGSLTDSRESDGMTASANLNEKHDVSLKSCHHLPDGPLVPVMGLIGRGPCLSFIGAHKLDKCPLSHFPTSRRPPTSACQISVQTNLKTSNNTKCEGNSMDVLLSSSCVNGKFSSAAGFSHQRMESIEFMKGQY